MMSGDCLIVENTHRAKDLEFLTRQDRQPDYGREVLTSEDPGEVATVRWSRSPCVPER